MLLVLLACSPIPEAYAKPAPPPPPGPSMGDVVRLHMSDNLASAISTRDAVIRGDLAEAREQLEWMANNEDPGATIDAGSKWLEELRGAARAGHQGRSVKEYGLAVGREGAACAGCHETLKAGLAQVTASRPTDGNGHGKLANWVVSTMWTGLIANSDAAWSAGVGGLEGLPQDGAGYWVGAPGPAASSAIDTLKAQSTSARSASERKSRGEAFGTVVGACGSCHAEVGAIKLAQ